MAELYAAQLLIESFSIIEGTFYRDFPGHTHAVNCFELHYVLDGRGELITEEKAYPLKKNTVYVTGPNSYHMQKTDPEKPMHEYCLFFKIEKPPADIFFNTFLTREFWIGRSNRTIRKLFDEIYKLAQDTKMYHTRQMALLVEMLILELSGIYEPQLLKLENKPAIQVTNEIVAIDCFFLYNTCNLTLGALASTLGLSERQTQRMLLKNYGKTFRQKKQDTQLEHAKILLSSGTSSLSEIAEECDFYGSAAFCHFFKKQTGMTPTEYREKKQNK